jgi:hypothetical protein
MSTETTIDDLAHEAWAAAQLAPGDSIDDAVRRIAGLIAAEIGSQARQIEALERDLLVVSREAFVLDALHTGMSGILRATAIAVRGPEVGGKPWNWSDLPRRVTAAIKEAGERATEIEALTAERDDLRKRLDAARHEPTGWLPIADAPKTGVILLAYASPNSRLDRFVYEGRWHADQGTWTGVSGFLVLAGVTHWMPLPPAPDATPAPGEWIEWAGGECPLDDSVRIDVKCRDGDLLQRLLPSICCWSHRADDLHRDIVAYRILP